MKKTALLVSCFNWYQGRLDTIRKLLLDKYDVKVLIADFDHAKKRKISKRFPECIYIKVPEYKKNLSIARIRSHMVFGRTVKKALDKYKPQLIYLQIPPNNCAIYCLQYKKHNADIKYYIDLIDLWPESIPIGLFGKTLLAKLWKKIRDNSLKAADYVFIECNFYKEALSGVLNPDKTGTLYLYKEQSKEERELVEQIIKGRKERKNKITFAYLGSINNIVDISSICKVLRSLNNDGNHTVIEVIGDGESRGEFLASLKGTGTEVHYHGAIYDEIKKIKILTPCDYAFNMMKNLVSVGLTIKSVDYFSYGLPLINTIKGDTSELVEQYGLGINFYNINKKKMKMLLERIEEQCNHKYILDIFDNVFSKERFVEECRRVILREK